MGKTQRTTLKWLLKGTIDEANVSWRTQARMRLHWDLMLLWMLITCVDFLVFNLTMPQFLHQMKIIMDQLHGLQAKLGHKRTLVYINSFTPHPCEGTPGSKFQSACTLSAESFLLLYPPAFCFVFKLVRDLGRMLPNIYG